MYTRLFYVYSKIMVWNFSYRFKIENNIIRPTKYMSKNYHEQLIITRKLFWRVENIVFLLKLKKNLRCRAVTRQLNFQKMFRETKYSILKSYF